ncbi:MAG: hypothetical protein ACD_10C00572G0003 [uncultured bacterium]|nr:MAG: hypothetical protein ACD_10C00572G0003 [uncultured bacterium]
MSKFFFGCLLALLTAVTHAGEAQPVAANSALEKHVMAISEELRCLVCQNQTIADSNADLAVDLRNQVREKLQQGMSERDIVAYMVQRYGDFVLYRPPVKSITWLLWFGPFLLLIGGIIFLGLKLFRGRPPVDDLPPADMQRAADLLRATPDAKEQK